jgi:hypothetical protein
MLLKLFPCLLGEEEHRKKAGIYVFCSAGNSGYNPDRSTVGFPANDKNTIAVASLDSNGERSSFSSVGEEVDFTGPGRSIWSTYKGDQLASLSGTSMSNPNVVGAACWLLSIFEEITTQDQLYAFMKEYITDLGAPEKDKFFGWGAPKVAPYLDEEPDDPEPPTPPQPENELGVREGGFAMRWRFSEESTDKIMQVSDIKLKVSGTTSRQELYDDTQKLLKERMFKYNHRLVVSSEVDEHFILMFIARIVELQARTLGLTVEVTYIEGTSHTHRSYFIDDFSFVRARGLDYSIEEI